MQTLYKRHHSAEVTVTPQGEIAKPTAAVAVVSRLTFAGRASFVAGVGLRAFCTMISKQAADQRQRRKILTQLAIENAECQHSGDYN